MADGATQSAAEEPESMTADAGAEDRAEIPAQRRANLLLAGAIKVNDTGMFERALRARADVNCENGLPLQLAAQAENALFLRRLVTAGADIPYAVAALKKEQAAIPRKERKHYDSYSYYTRTTYTYKSKEEKQRWEQISAAIKTLGAYAKTYVTEALPLESVRVQHQTLIELQELKSEILTALHGKALSKKKLPPPAPGRG